VSPDGEQLGIRPLPEALKIARDEGLDLVEVAEKANPPVCKIMDYGKFKYEAAQRAKESRKKSSHVQVKEMKYRPKIGRGDFMTKTRKVLHFLEEGNRVKITIMFRGREMQHPELGRKILDEIAELGDDVSRIEAYPKIDGRNMIMVLVPDKEKIALKHKAEQEAAEAEEAEAAQEAVAAQAPVEEAPVEEAPVADTEAAEAPEPDTEAAEVSVAEAPVEEAAAAEADSVSEGEPKAAS